MRTVWVALGRLIGYLTWPGIWLVIRFTTRTRVLVVHDDRVLLLQAWWGTGSWLCAGGGIKRSERPAEAAVRELHEETGIVVSADQLKPLGKLRQTRGLAHKFYGFVLVLSSPPQLQLRSHDIVEAQWFEHTKALPKRCQQHLPLLLEAWQAKR